MPQSSFWVFSFPGKGWGRLCKLFVVSQVRLTTNIALTLSVEQSLTNSFIVKKILLILDVGQVTSCVAFNRKYHRAVVLNFSWIMLTASSVRESSVTRHLMN